MSLIALLRHGHQAGTEDPDAPVYTAGGPGLSGLGREQAEAARRFLEPLRPTRIISSNAPRAIETAEIVGDARPVYVVDDLRGLFLGDWEGVSGSAMAELPAVVFEPERRPPNGESLSDLLVRVRRGFHDNLPEEGDAIVVGHLLVNAVVLADAMGWPLAAAGLIRQEPGTVNILERRRGGLGVLMLNVNPLDPLRSRVTAASLV